MQTKSVATAILVGMLCWWAHAASASNLFVNGDFEGGTYPQVFGSSTDTLPTGWTNSPPTNSSNLNVFANGSGPGSAESGTHYIAFQSAVTDGTQDCLNQVISTVPNQKYTVSFWVAMTASSGSQYGLGPEWDSGGANDTFDGHQRILLSPHQFPGCGVQAFFIHRNRVLQFHKYLLSRGRCHRRSSSRQRVGQQRGEDLGSRWRRQLVSRIELDWRRGPRWNRRFS